MLELLSIFSYLLIFLLLIALAWRDAKEYILPDLLNATLAITFGAFHTSLDWHLLSPLSALGGALAGGGFLYVIRALALRFYHEDSLGLGDVKLMAAAGFGLGPQGIFMALTIGSAAGVLHGLSLAFYERLKNNHKIKIAEVNVPAGVGLAFGIMVTMYLQFGFEWLNLLQK